MERIWHISDTHGFHDLLQIPDGVVTVILSGYDTVFSNGSVVTDGRFGKLSSNGNMITL